MWGQKSQKTLQYMGPKILEVSPNVWVCVESTSAAMVAFLLQWRFFLAVVLGFFFWTVFICGSSSFSLFGSLRIAIGAVGLSARPCGQMTWKQCGLLMLSRTQGSPTSVISAHQGGMGYAGERFGHPRYPRTCRWLHP